MINENKFQLLGPGTTIDFLKVFCRKKFTIQDLSIIVEDIIIACQKIVENYLLKNSDKFLHEFINIFPLEIQRKAKEILLNIYLTDEGRKTFIKKN